MQRIETGSPVLVTGATGYLAGWIVKGLLEAGATVHAAVRSPDKPEKIGHLVAMAEKVPERLRFFKADLLDQGSYREAMAGCRVVFHTASPFTTEVSDPQRELVDPALLGTRNVLEEACRTGSVERVVLTSSVAAIYGDNADIAKAPGGVLTEEVWNTTSSLEHGPYSYSKTLAEREAWRIAGTQTRWRLVVVNPSLVVGPGTNPASTSESFNILRQYGDGTLRTGIPRWGMGVVDVRDVAQAHLAAGFSPDAEGRYIVSGHETDLHAMAGCLVGKFGDRFPIPRFALPKWACWLFGPLVNRNMTRRAVSANVDVPFRADNRKAIRELGVTYRPLRQSMEEMFQQMVDSGWFRR